MHRKRKVADRNAANATTTLTLLVAVLALFPLIQQNWHASIPIGEHAGENMTLGDAYLALLLVVGVSAYLYSIAGVGVASARTQPWGDASYRMALFLIPVVAGLGVLSWILQGLNMWLFSATFVEYIFKSATVFAVLMLGVGAFLLARRFRNRPTSTTAMGNS